MARDFKRPAALLAAAVLLAALAACAGEEPGAGRAFYSRSGGSGARYTKSDYALLQSLRTEGFRDMTLEAFNAALLDWDDEEAYHANEAALLRLNATLPEDDPLRPFFDATVRPSWDECDVRHYSACARSQDPQAGGVAEWERQEDVYGDPVTTAYAWADYWYAYSADWSAVTVGERDDFLRAVSDGMQSFLDSRTDEQRRDQAGMEKALKAELERLTRDSGGAFTVSGWNVDYLWEQIY